MPCRLQIVFGLKPVAVQSAIVLDEGSSSVSQFIGSRIIPIKLKSFMSSNWHVLISMYEAHLNALGASMELTSTNLFPAAHFSLRTMPVGRLGPRRRLKRQKQGADGCARRIRLNGHHSPLFLEGNGGACLQISSPKSWIIHHAGLSIL